MNVNDDMKNYLPIRTSYKFGRAHLERQKGQRVLDNQTYQTFGIEYKFVPACFLVSYKRV